MAYENGQELLNDVLFRGGEPQSSASDYYATAMGYINRSYRSLAAGSNEFLANYVDDWWWLRSRSVLELLPVFDTGTVAVTMNSTTVTFSNPPSYSLANRRLKITGHSELYVITAHTGGAGSATIDQRYLQESDTTADFKAMAMQYTLGADVQALTSPMVGYGASNLRIRGITPEAMDEKFPLGTLRTGLPTHFAILDENVVRFSHGGPTDGISRRIEYRYRPFITDLTANTDSEPLVPLQWRHVLSDMATYMLLMDKNDDRAGAVKDQASTSVAAMVRENRRRLAKTDDTVGRIFPRQGQLGYGNNRLRAGYTADG